MPHRNQSGSDPLALRHIPLLPSHNTLGWHGRSLMGTSPYERKIIRLWAEETGLERCYLRITRPLPDTCEEFGDFLDVGLLVMIDQREDYEEFMALLGAIPPRTVRVPSDGRLTRDQAMALKGTNVRLLRGSRGACLSVQEGVWSG